MQFGHFKLILVLYLATLPLQAKESFKNFHSYKAELNENFKEYKDENERGFRALLSGEWSSYKATQDELYEQKKPQTTPTKSFEKVVGVGPKVYIDVKETKELPTQTLSGNIDFFGTKLSINIPVYENAPNLSSHSKNSILSFFDYLAKENINSTIADIKSTRGEFALNDWAIYLLVEHISSKVFSDERAKLLSWVIFNKLGYSVKAGVAKDKIALLFYSKKSIYATPAYVFGTKKYYFVGATSAPAVYTYKDELSTSGDDFDLSLKILPRFTQDVKEKTIGFDYDGKRYDFHLVYNKNLVDFMATYPQASYDIYFNSPLEDVTYATLSKDFATYLDGKKSSWALDFVLKFVQNGFIYEVDDKQFGKEKSMFSLETLYYDKSDCEDRAVLFSTLVKKLFGFEVVALRYDDHITTALNIPLEGDNIKIEKKDFVIADPTYINAKIGQSMPKYNQIKPKSYIIVQ